MAGSSFRPVARAIRANGGLRMVDYLVVALQHPSGGWVAVLPDFVGVTGRATSMQHAIDRATAAAREFCAIVFGIKKAMPEPCALAAVQRNLRWAKEYGVDWQQAVIQTVALAPPGTAQRRTAARRESKVVEWSRRAAARRTAQQQPPVAAE
jgi:predicted RNase H-like HicB family nuclease